MGKNRRRSIHKRRRHQPTPPVSLRPDRQTQPTVSSPPRDRFPPWPTCLALGLLVIASYFPVGLNGFVWDDRAFIEALPVQELSGLWRIWFSPSEIQGEGHYWPLTYTTFWLEHKLWGFSPVGFHTVNLLLHFANTLLLGYLLRALAVPGAWVIAAVFAVHPVHVEAVAWAIGRKDLLATLFYLSAVLAWVSFTEESRAKRKTKHYLLALGLFTAGLLCKSIGVTLPAALLIWHWWQRGRVTGEDLLQLAPFFAVGLGIAAADFSYYQEIVAIDYTLPERVLIAAHALWFYLGKLLWPTNLIVIYPHWDVEALNPFAWVYPIAIIAVALLLWLLRARIGRGPLAGVLFFGLTLLPVLGFVDFGYMQFSFVADRYQYLAGIGTLAVIISAVVQGLDRLPEAIRLSTSGARLLRWGAVGVATLVLVSLGALTWRQTGVYRDEITFFNYIISHNPTARNVHLNLGKALFESGQREAGLEAIRTAIEQRPTSIKAHYSAGLMLMHLGRLEEAEERLRHALRLNPNNRFVQYSTGLVLSKLGRLDEAERHYRQTLKIDPYYLEAQIGISTVLIDLGRLDEAEQYLNRVLKLNPRHPRALMSAAVLQFKRKHYAAALSFYRSVTEIEPGNAMAWSGAGAALYYLGRNEEALQNIDHALTLDPALAEARANREAIRQSESNP